MTPSKKKGNKNNAGQLKQKPKKKDEKQWGRK